MASGYKQKEEALEKTQAALRASNAQVVELKKTASVQVQRIMDLKTEVKLLEKQLQAQVKKAERDVKDVEWRMAKELDTKDKLLKEAGEERTRELEAARNERTHAAMDGRLMSLTAPALRLWLGAYRAQLAKISASE